jgi:hypothetical protein
MFSSLISGKVQVVLVCIWKVLSAHILWGNKKLWPLCLILSAFSKKLTTERRYSYFIKDNTTVHTERTSSEWYSASSGRVADGSLLDPQIWINMINICGGHKEISCMNLKTIFRDRMLMCQDKSQEIFSKCETCFESRCLHSEIHICWWNCVWTAWQKWTPTF